MRRIGSTGKKALQAAFVALMIMIASADASAAADQRELKAREHFVAGRYQEALDLFAKLYAETLHPIYLRNIGRCYQNLGEAERAITTFRDYLRKAKPLKPEERQEVEAFIAEMEELKKQKEARASSNGGTPAAGATSSATEPVTPIGKAPPPANDNGSSNTAAASVVLTPQPPPPAESAPIYTRWWFWAIVGGAVAAGLGTAFALGAFTRTEDASCPMGFTGC